VLGFLLSLVQVAQGNPFAPLPLLPPGVILAALFLVSRYVTIPQQAKRIFHQNRELHAPQELEFSTAAMKLTNAYGHTERPWDMFVKWKENDDSFLRYHSDSAFNLVPKRFFPDRASVQFVRDQLLAHHVPVGGTPIVMMMSLIILVLTLLAIVQLGLR
jgi:hypothetical protein